MFESPKNPDSSLEVSVLLTAFSLMHAATHKPDRPAVPFGCANRHEVAPRAGMRCLLNPASLCGELRLQHPGLKSVSEPELSKKTLSVQTRHGQSANEVPLALVLPGETLALACGLVPVVTPGALSLESGTHER